MAKPSSDGISAVTPSALDHPSARDARTLIRSAVKAALATSDHQNGHPYASLILAGTTFEGAPVTLISDLAVHTRNIKQRPQVSMLFDGTADNGDPMAGGRVSVSGTMEPIADPDEREAASVRFLRRHPSAAAYADFADFGFYRLLPQSAHYIGGFGRIIDIPSHGLMYTIEDIATLKDAESCIISQINMQHAAELNHYVDKLSSNPSSEHPWHLIACDPDGVDFSNGQINERLSFDKSIFDPQSLKTQLLQLLSEVE